MNGKFYIGMHKTDDLNDGYMGSGKLLKRAIDKYGIENFTKEILFDFQTEEEMIAKEAELVTFEFIKNENTYNLCEGGKGGFSYVNRSGLNLYGYNEANLLNEEIRAKGVKTWERMRRDPEFMREYSTKMSLTLKNYYMNNDHTWLGRVHSQETKDKIGKANAIAQSGSKNSQFGTIWITDGLSNKKQKSSDAIPNGWRKGRTK